jgi:hypothetical protein
MTPNELIEYIARVESHLRSDINVIENSIEFDANHSDHYVRLQWCIAHLNGSFTDFYRDLERLQQELQRGIDAGTKIQDKLR